MHTSASFRPALFFCLAILASAAPYASNAADERVLVEMPEHMQAHMLGNMRDHLRALDDILGFMALGEVNGAGAVAEQRLGLGSLDDHGAAHLAGFMPDAMQAFGTEMHKAASRFAQVAQNADVERTYEAQQKVFEALRDITTQCNGCHTHFRIR